jgi:hypothetical protein
MGFFEGISEVNWGTFPSYFGGIALLLTAWTMFQGQRADVREQANKVAAWVDRQDGKTVLKMKNASDLPITSAYVVPGYNERNALVLAKDDASATRKGKPLYLPSGVGPDQTVVVRTYDEGTTVRVISFYFTDARGRRWKRIGGKLTKVRLKNPSS